MINIELNITLKCNLACPSCNRLCNVYRDREEHMSVDQIKKFIQQAKVGGGVNKIKIIGGEPLLHPQFDEIYNLLLDAAKNNIIRSIKVETNRTIPVPTHLEKSNLIRWKGTLQRKKKHQPFLWSPRDLGYENGPQPRCPQITKCGYSLDKYGYLPCSLAIMISRLFGFTDLYKYELPTSLWGLEKLCPNCIFSMNPEWRKKYSGKSILQHTKEDQMPTKTYQEKITNFDVKEFYKTQKEF